MTKTPLGNNAPEPMDEDEEEQENGVSASSEDNDKGASEDDEVVVSHHPKDMALRSGKRKRRRSIDTSGLTPPNINTTTTPANKRHKSTVKKSKDSDTEMDDDNESGKVHQQNGSKPALAAAQVAAPGDEEEEEEVVPAQAQQQQAAPLQKLRVPSQHTPGNLRETARPAASLAEAPDLGRRLLFVAQPPVGREATATTHHQVSEDASPAAKEPQQQQEDGHQYTNGEASEAIPEEGGPPGLIRKLFGRKQREPESEVEVSGDGTTDDNLDLHPSVTTPVGWFMIFFVLQIICYTITIHPVLTTVAATSKRAIVFYKSYLPTPETPEVIEMVPEVAESQVETEVIVEEPKPSDYLLEQLQALNFSKHQFSEVINELKNESNALEGFIKNIQTQIKERERDAEIRSNRLSDVQALLGRALGDSDLQSSTWVEAREAVSTLGLTLLDLSSVELWQIDQPHDCTINATVTDDEEDVDVLPSLFASPEMVEGRLNDLLLQARMAADMIMSSSESEDRVRAWVRMNIGKAARGDRDAVTMLKGMTTTPSTSMGSGQMAELIQERLEMERADGTGRFDFASLLSGAKIVLGGRRGTSRSLVDALPIFNRLMHLMSLRFYGFGPEAALMPTYPADALGQCWAFEQVPLKEQIKQRRITNNNSNKAGDDHKRGNYGTLTISLPAPVHVESVVIEHPSMDITEQVTTAIRSFRIIGYMDPEASEKAWTLGSFEYDMRKKNPMQEFKVATDIFGTPVPPLHSITLAIDSNWGFDYACLYRFRVHGTEAEEEEEIMIGGYVL
jgi:hypothetical protein